MIIQRGRFDNFRYKKLNESRADIIKFSEKKSIFISHKHDDLEDLKGLIGFLEERYNVVCYIDSRDSTMPSVTSKETGAKLKERIRNCNKFILLATNGAIESKWCNWELGYGDSVKYPNNIAILPMRDRNETYKGSEYMGVYPSIEYYDGTTKYSSGKLIEKGYYVVIRKEDKKKIKKLEKWLWG